ncbi:PTS fructose transporter subunit IIABC [Clostridium algidicarnis]|uniref:PTS fructose transporter subunit IIABC n=1 Tax=Clostridium algidicarnis TaxID=37659 RepID=UPI000496563C|nr:fructose-specific PTS transporter subunit EIIC [Clostridium algidicarnis]
MKIIDLLNKSGIELNPIIITKNEAISRLVDLMDGRGILLNKEEYKNEVLKREEISTTGIGDGIAIPHAKTKAVKKAGLSAMVIKDGLDYDSLDGEKAKLFFMIAAPEGEDNIHLEVLSRLSTILMDEDFRNSLIDAKDKEEFLRLIDFKENNKITEEKDKEKDKIEQKDGYRVLAVTACPTGIAHTFMAAESLENKGKDMDITIKVETNGAGGAKNILTKDEIEKAECIIIAADKNVEMARFDGKKVIQTRVSNGIHKPQELISEAISGNVPIYHYGSKGKDEEDVTEKEGLGREIYKHLMNGVSHMLPFVIGGGILIALAFLFDDYSIDPSNFGSNTPFAEFLMKVGGTSFGFMLPVLAGYIAMSIGDRPALAVGFVGGMLANEGGSGFLGALLAGFIAGYLVVALKKVFSKLPSSLEGIKPVLIYPLLGILLIGVIIVYGINPPLSALNNGITTILNNMGESSKIVLGAVLGGMMAIDMGGPINKAAYVFGTASLANNQFHFMAAVMIGGMVPPLSIALCTTFFKNRFTKKERQSGLVNYIMGLSFITEGAIPFAAADPLRVIPACVIGSATAGALSMAFGCTLRAPHGGIFVLPVISNPLGYFISLVVGSVIGMIVMAMLKKKVIE